MGPSPKARCHGSAPYSVEQCGVNIHMFYRLSRWSRVTPQQRLDFANEFLLRLITTGNFAYYGRTRRISP
ncbi:hypothetical protein TNCV_398271 [Trichonephila clavipes]|nr:hypothetical protein TNCV_398271 [Trichonephila clavipes]